MNVRQKHAHSWVEAYAGPEPDTEKVPIWIVLDPTPGTERQESIAHVGGIAGNFRPITDVIRHIWVFYIVGYDGERQNRLLYAPMREMVREIQKQVQEARSMAERGGSRSCFIFLTSAPSSASAASSSLSSRCCLLAGWPTWCIRLGKRS